MDRNSALSTTQQKKKALRKKKTPKKTDSPLKIVYISNPMRFHTSASEFRSLVQELTGQDAEFPDPEKIPVAGAEETLSFDNKVAGDSQETEDSGEFKSQYYESFDDVLMNQMMENLDFLYGADRLV